MLLASGSRIWVCHCNNVAFVSEEALNAEAKVDELDRFTISLFRSSCLSFHKLQLAPRRPNYVALCLGARSPRGGCS